MVRRQKSRKMSFVLSVLGHGAIVLALTFSLPLSSDKRAAAPASTVIPIESVMIDASAVQAEIDRIDAAQEARARQEQEAAERIQREREEAERQLAAEQEAANQARIAQEQAAAELAEQQQAADAARIQLQREAEAEAAAIRVAEQQAAERQARIEAEQRAAEEAAAEAERQRQAAEARLAAEEAERKRKEEERLAAERAAEEERQRQEQLRRDEAAREVALAAAAEQEARAARDAGLQDQWLAAIENKVTRYWRRPPTAEVGLECVLIVNLIPSGDVTAVQVVSNECNADATTIRSIENAINEASPLPQPPVPSVFERVIRFRFKPDA